MTIRSYGPGKFDDIIDSYVYALSAEGWDQDSVGDVTEVGVYLGRLHLGDEAAKRIVEIAAEQKDEITSEELEFIRSSYGAIYSENDQGFVSVSYYDTKEDYDADWKEAEDEVNAASDEGEGEEEYDVIVGNIGNVYSGTDEDKARATYKEYVEQSKSGVGRAGGEDVTLMLNDEIEDEFIGSIRAATEE